MPVLRLAHVSDLHIPARWPRAPWLYAGKRLVGAVNYAVRRAGEHPLATVSALVDELASDKTIDHVAITGDLTNLSFPGEFARAREVLRPLLDRPGFVSVIPGNHDRYTYTSHRRRYFEKSFADFATSELDLWPGFPFVRFRNGVAILGCDSGVPTLPFQATGTLGDEQRERVARALAEPRVREAHFRVLLVHHAPLGPGARRDRFLHRLTDDRETLALAHAGRVELMLHGHIHLPFAIEHRSGEHLVRGIGAGSSTRLHRSPEKVGGINIYTIRDGVLAEVETRTFDPATGKYSGRRAFPDQLLPSSLKSAESIRRSV